MSPTPDSKIPLAVKVSKITTKIIDTSTSKVIYGDKKRKPAKYTNMTMPARDILCVLMIEFLR
jgi:hypothetical protein